MTTALINLPAAIELMARSMGVRQAKDMMYVRENLESFEGSIFSQNAQIFPAGACASAILAIGKHLADRGINIEPILELVRGFDDTPTRWTNPIDQLRVLQDLTCDPHHAGFMITRAELIGLDAAFDIMRDALLEEPRPTTTLSPEQQELWNRYVDQGVLVAEKFVI